MQNENENAQIVAMKGEIYDLIERQAMYSAEVQRLEQAKGEKLKALNELRQAAQAAEAEAPATPKKK